MTDCGAPLFSARIPPSPMGPVLARRGYVFRRRHGHVDWHNLSPLEAVTMLAAMIDQSEHRAPDPADRYATYIGILHEIRRRFDPGKRSWTGEDVGDAVLSLAERGALMIRPGRVQVLAWPIPGGAPW